VNRRALGCLLEIIETLLLALIVFVLVQLFVAQPYQVQQESMENTLMPSQYVLVDKLTPRFDPYHRGDIVVFNPPANWQEDPTGTPYIKRIIGIPGDTVEISDGQVFVNGSQLDEPYLFENQPTEATGTNLSWTLKDNQYFVMGDHRAASQDSRVFGPITKESIIGRAWLRYWPMDQFGVLPRGEPSTASSPSASSPSPAPSSR
jgi:signal peptidase I